jgi:hypothetical protein
MIHKNYSGLFPSRKNKKPTQEKKKETFEAATKISDKFKWHSIIHQLIKELNTTEKEVYKMNYISCLNWLSYFKERDDVINNINKKNKKK